MSPTCCARSYAGSMRPCPRCSKWICHHCGVIAHGALVCADCSVKPPERISDELAFSALRFGVRAGSRGSRGCGWTVLAAATTVPGFFLALWLGVVVAVNTALHQAGLPDRAGPFDRRVFYTLFHLWSEGLMAPVAVGLVLAILAATIPVKRY